MHVLMTADTVGGVWTYTRELVTQLSRRGIMITLVSFGELPSAAQSEWIEELPDVSFHPTAFRLEWMQDAQSDLRQSTEFLQSIIAEAKPDLLHFNQFYFGGLDWDLPRIVVAHSDVISWWVSVHGAEPPDSDWIHTYRENVVRGWRGADLAIAPTRWMLGQACAHLAIRNERKLSTTVVTPTCSSHISPKRNTQFRLAVCGMPASSQLCYSVTICHLKRS